MQDTSSAANHRRSNRAYRTNGLEAAQAVEDDTWFEVVSVPPQDTPLIALIPLPRKEGSSGA